MDLAADLSQISARYAMNEVGVGKEGGDFAIREGFSAIATGMAAGLTIRFSTAVSGIDWTSKVARLSTTAGEVRADAVIVTVSLGILKAATIDFQPALPAAHRRAISALGYGTAEKVALIYADKWWQQLPNTDIRWMDSEHPRWGEWFDLSDAVGQPCISSLSAGSGARSVAELDAATAVTDAADTFERLVAVVGAS